MNDTDLSASLTRHDLPLGWAWSTVAGVGDVNLGRQRSPKNRSADFPTKYIRAANLTWTGIDLSEVLEMDFKPNEREVYRLRVGDVLLSEASGSSDQVGKAAVWKLPDEDYCFQNTVIRFRPREILPEFAQAIFSHYARNGIFGRVAVGVGIQHLGADRLSSMPFPVPPLNEQRRIVAKIDEQFSDLDAAVATLERVKTKLKRYRASVLKAAIEGKLTAEWRQQHPATEPATALLERILVERQRRWEDAQRAKFAASEKTLPANWQAKYPEPVGPDTSALPLLPDGWCWASVDQLSVIQGGIQKQPKRAPANNAYPFLRVANVYRGRLDLSDVRRIELLDGELDRLRLEKGDLLIVEGNGSITEIGRSAIWTGEIEDCVHQNHLIRVRLLLCDPRYFDAYWNSPIGNRQVMAVAASTSGLYTLSVSKVSSLHVPLPPLAEQAAIIEEVESRLTVV